MTMQTETSPFLSLCAAGYRLPDGSDLVHSASFDLKQGEILVIAGPNGAGKTTLIRMIAGLLTPTDGKVLLRGTCVTSMRSAERARHIAYVGQTDSIDGRLTVEQYVALGLLPLATRHPPLTPGDALRHVGLSGLANRTMEQLSGGERQKARIARAMCQNPTLLILDEPTNHLDPQARGAVLGLAKGLGITVVAALHDLTLIDSFADKVTYITDGNLSPVLPPEIALEAERVNAVFGVDLHRFKHPNDDRFLTTLDIRMPTQTTVSHQTEQDQK